MFQNTSTALTQAVKIKIIGKKGKVIPLQA
jgi:hypothetical protein